jgi:hypothetical protein
MAIGTAYVQGEDVAAKGRVLLFSFSKSENSQNLVLEGGIMIFFNTILLVFQSLRCVSGNMSMLVSG